MFTPKPFVSPGKKSVVQLPITTMSLRLSTDRSWGDTRFMAMDTPGPESPPAAIVRM